MKYLFIVMLVHLINAIRQMNLYYTDLIDQNEQDQMVVRRDGPLRLFLAPAPLQLHSFSNRSTPTPLQPKTFRSGSAPLQLRSAPAPLRLHSGSTPAPLRSSSAPLQLRSGSTPAPLRLRFIQNFFASTYSGQDQNMFY